MKTPAKKIVRVLSHSGRSHVSFARFGSRNATRSLVGQWGTFLKIQLQGNGGRTWENLGELGRAGDICVDLWGSVGCCGEPALWKLLVPCRISMKSKEKHRRVMYSNWGPISGLHYFVTGVVCSLSLASNRLTRWWGP